MEQQRQQRGTAAAAAAARTLTRLVRELLPRAKLCFAAGYGSGVFTQRTQASTSSCDGRAQEGRETEKVLDCLLVVGGGRRELWEWHAANIARNAAHYGGVLPLVSSRADFPRHLAESAVDRGCGAHFVAPFAVDDDVDDARDSANGGARRCKYGVLGIDDAVDDLESWRMLAFAGRMQKPTLELKLELNTGDGDGDGDEEEGARRRLLDAQAQNLRSALAASILLLPDEFDERALFRTLVSLSYGGDVRLSIGAERPSKVSDIADGSAAAMRSMYADHARVMLERVPSIRDVPHESRFRSAVDRRELLRLLPEWPLRECAALLSVSDALASSRARIDAASARVRNADAIWRACARGHGDEGGSRGTGTEYEALRSLVRRALRRIVFRSSSRMLIHSALTTDATRACRYVVAKLAKGLMR